MIIEVPSYGWLLVLSFLEACRFPCGIAVFLLVFPEIAIVVDKKKKT
jgi:hypothetical protein